MIVVYNTKVNESIVLAEVLQKKYKSWEKQKKRNAAPKVVAKGAAKSIAD